MAWQEYRYQAQVVRIIDGDTVEVCVDLGFKLRYYVHVRLAHVNAPELSTMAGRDARTELIEHLGPLPVDVKIQTYKSGTDRYGRWLADIFYGGESLSAWLLASDLATPYEGGAR